MISICALSVKLEAAMAVPVGHNARKGAVKKRTRLRTRSPRPRPSETIHFMAVKKSAKKLACEEEKQWASFLSE
jgi:hypothetical protein